MKTSEIAADSLLWNTFSTLQTVCQANQSDAYYCSARLSAVQHCSHIFQYIDGRLYTFQQLLFTESLQISFLGEKTLRIFFLTADPENCLSSNCIGQCPVCWPRLRLWGTMDAFISQSTCLGLGGTFQMLSRCTLTLSFKEPLKISQGNWLSMQTDATQLETQSKEIAKWKPSYSFPNLLDSVNKYHQRKGFGSYQINHHL